MQRFYLGMTASVASLAMACSGSPNESTSTELASNAPDEGAVVPGPTGSVAVGGSSNGTAPPVISSPAASGEGDADEGYSGDGDAEPASGTPGGGVGAGGSSSGGASGFPVGAGGAGGAGPIPGEGTATPNLPQSGMLTAGTWDDNLNFDFFLSYRQNMLAGQGAGLLPIDISAHEAAHTLFANASARQTLDVALILDTTGSMGDEMSYLQAEFLSLSSTIKAVHPNADQRWSLVVYRDVGDLYVVNSFDFSSDLAEFQANLSAQFVDGGGDFPEAPDAALAHAAELSWRTGASNARLSFLVADAPHHEQNAAAMAAAITDLQDLDVHVYPVASSGVDELTELTFRSAAQMTGGRYLFLTSDSGVGGEHKEPTIPCYYVTRLNHAMLRMIDIELSGDYHGPTPEEVIRTSGIAENGECLPASEHTVTQY